MFEVRKAKRQRRPLKISLEGLSGSGKTFTALRLAFAMKRAGIGNKIVVADSENESAGLYDGVVMDGEKWEYDVCPIPHLKQNPAGYAECYDHLVKSGFDIIIIDSLSHAWHGAQEIVDRHAQANKGDKFGGWAKVSPDQRKMLTLLTDTRAHTIATMRVKSEYERIDDGGKTKIKKVGMKTDQRDGSEYEFDCVIRLDVENHAGRIEKVRGCIAMDGAVGDHLSPEFFRPLFNWWLSAPEAEPVVSQSEKTAAALLLSISATKTLGELKQVMSAVNQEAKNGHIGAEHIARITEAKDARKAALSPKPAPESPPIGPDEVDEHGHPILFANAKPSSGVPHQ